MVINSIKSLFRKKIPFTFFKNAKSISNNVQITLSNLEILISHDEKKHIFNLKNVMEMRLDEAKETKIVFKYVEKFVNEEKKNESINNSKDRNSTIINTYTITDPSSSNTLVTLYESILPLLKKQKKIKKFSVKYFQYVHKNTSQEDSTDQKVSNRIKNLNEQFHFVDNVTFEIVSELGEFFRITSDGNVLLHYEELSPSLQFYLDTESNSFIFLSHTENELNNLSDDDFGEHPETFKVEFTQLDFLEFMSWLMSVLKDEEICLQQENIGFDLNNNSNDQEVIEEKNLNLEHEPDCYKSGQNNEDEEVFHNDILLGDDQNVFVTRGNNLGVFLHKDGLKYNHTIKDIPVFDTKKMLKRTETDLLIHKMNNLALLDLEKGKIANSVNIQSNDVFQKNNQLIGCGDNEIFLVDMRVKEGVGLTIKNEEIGKPNSAKPPVSPSKNTKRNLVEPIPLTISDASISDINSSKTSLKKYKTKTLFSKASCSENTKNNLNTAIVSKQGDLRIYDDLTARAKIKESGMGDEPVCIDQFYYTEGVNTKNEMADLWESSQNLQKELEEKEKNDLVFLSSPFTSVLITYEKYLLLYVLSSKKKDRKMYRLGLRPEHITELGLKLDFKGGKFSLSGEYLIVHNAEYLISWRVSDIIVKKMFFNYKIRRYTDEIRDNVFIEGERVVITLKDDIKMLRRGRI